MKTVRIIISRTFGIIFFLILLLVANWLTKLFDFALYNLIVDFLNINAALLIIMTVIFMLAELFHEMEFPLNLPSPLFGAIASLLLAHFILSIIGLLDIIFNIGLSKFSFLKYIIYTLVFVIVMIVGYVKIFKKD